MKAGLGRPKGWSGDSIYIMLVVCEGRECDILISYIALSRFQQQ